MINLTKLRNITGEPNYPDNKHLRTKKGNHEYLLAFYTEKEPRSFIRYEKVKGSVFYPFAVRKVPTESGFGYTVDHLPTGAKAGTKGNVWVLRKKAVGAIKALLRETRSGAFSGTKFTDKNYKKLQEIFI